MNENKEQLQNKYICKVPSLPALPVNAQDNSLNEYDLMGTQ